LPFTIRFRDEPNTYTDDDSTWAIGRIVAGELDEEFHADLHDWSTQEYEAQWLQALEGLLLGEQRAVLITRYVNQEESDNLEWWALYRDDDTVHVQNHLPFYAPFGRKFSAAEASTFLHDRVMVDPEGNKVSEWAVPVRDIELFVAEIKQRRSD
jgi:hypothetical protein